MAFQSKVGNFAQVTSGSPQAITGLGFQPTALILWTSSGIASGTFIDKIQTSIGITDGATSRSVGVKAIDAATDGLGNRTRAISGLLTVHDGTSTIFQCGLTSFDADGFTLAWSTNDGVARIIHYIAFGGDVVAKVVDWTFPSSSTTKAITGVGFQPKMLIHLTANATGAVSQSIQNIRWSIGAETDATHGWSIFTGSDSVTPSTAVHVQQTTKSLLALRSDGSSIDNEGLVSTMDADGFTFNATSRTASIHVYTLCLAGGNFAVGASAKPTSGAPASHAISGLGFTPQGFFLATVDRVAAAGIANGVRLTLGAGATGSEQASTMEFKNAVSIMDCSAYDRTDKLMGLVDNDTKNTDAAADITSLDTDGFTLSWTTNNANAWEILWFAFGPSAAPSILPPFPNQLIRLPAIR